MGLFKWIKKRVTEPSTYSGIGMVVVGAGTAIGKPELAASITPLVELLAPILMTLGGILIGKPAPEPEQGALPLRR